MTLGSSAAIVLRWAAAYAATECIVVAVASIAVATSWPAIVACGVIEGSVLGVLQGSLLFGRRFVPVLIWMVATIAGMLAGRLIEFVANSSPLAATLLRAEVGVQLLAGAALGLCVGAATGLAQAFVLPRGIRAGYRWIGVCAVAWALTLPALLVVGRVIASISDLPGLVAVSIVFALFASVGAFVGLFEGAGLALMMPRFTQSRMADRV